MNNKPAEYYYTSFLTGGFCLPGLKLYGGFPAREGYQKSSESFALPGINLISPTPLLETLVGTELITTFKATTG